MNNITYLNCRNYVKFFFLFLPSNHLKSMTGSHNYYLKRKKTRNFEFNLHIPGTHDQGVRDKPLFSCQFRIGMRVYTRTVKITQLAAEKSASLRHAILKGTSTKSSRPFQSLYGDQPDFWDSEWHDDFLICHLSCPHMQKFVQVLLGVNLRSLSVSKYSLENLSTASHYHPTNNVSWLLGGL